MLNVNEEDAKKMCGWKDELFQHIVLNVERFMWHPILFSQHDDKDGCC